MCEWGTGRQGEGDHASNSEIDTESGVKILNSFTHCSFTLSAL